MKNYEHVLMTSSKVYYHKEGKNFNIITNSVLTATIGIASNPFF